MAVDVEKELTFIRNIPGFGQYLGRALRGIVDGLNGLSQNVSVDSTSTLPPPPTIQQLNVKTDGNGNVHAVINDSNPIQKNTHYFLEFATDEAFTQPHVVHLGPSRTMRPMPLPAFDDNGKAQSWHFRAYSQQQGSMPSPPVNFGSPGKATPVSVGGTSRLTLLPSTGSGTAPPSGQSAGQGFGKTLFRPAQGPKRKSTS